MPTPRLLAHAPPTPLQPSTSPAITLDPPKNLPHFLPWPWHLLLATLPRSIRSSSDKLHSRPPQPSPHITTPLLTPPQSSIETVSIELELLSHRLPPTTPFQHTTTFSSHLKLTHTLLKLTHTLLKHPRSPSSIRNDQPQYSFAHTPTPFSRGLERPRLSLGTLPLSNLSSFQPSKTRLLILLKPGLNRTARGGWACCRKS